MTRTPRLTSDTAACCWIPLFALRCETARRPELASLPLALLAPDDTRRLWQVAPLARRAGREAAGGGSRGIGQGSRLNSRHVPNSSAALCETNKMSDSRRLQSIW